MAKADATLARKESQLLGALDSPFCADLLGVYEDDRQVWLASTLHVGGELFHRIVDNSDRGATFSEPEAAMIFAQPSCCLGQLLSTELCCRDNSWPRQQQRKSAAAEHRRPERWRLTETEKGDQETLPYAEEEDEEKRYR